jgi:predicted nucleotidyltransferase
MRLSGRLKYVLKSTLKEIFCTNDAIIFGSRVDDNAIGGDIDIAIKTEISASEFRKNKIMFFTALIRQDYDLKIDLVQYHQSMDALLKKEIQQSGVLI